MIDGKADAGEHILKSGAAPDAKTQVLVFMHFVYISGKPNIYKYIFSSLYIYASIYIHICIHTHTHTHARTHTHTYIYI